VRENDRVREAIIEYQPRIREMPTSERPRERLRAVGVGPLRTAELLAILLRTGGNGENVVQLGERLIAKFDGLPGLARATVAQLCDVKGIGEAKAAQVLAGIELGKRIVSAPEERAVIRCSADIERLYRPSMLDLEQEEVRVLMVDTRNRVMRSEMVYRGSAHTVAVRVGDLFREAVREGATGMAVVHNHPSGDPAPSAQDVDLTRQVVEAGKLLGIEVLDHVVIARGGYVSMREKGLWPQEASRAVPKAAG
jgi:DNA repair protein RadC